MSAQGHVISTMPLMFRHVGFFDYLPVGWVELIPHRTSPRVFFNACLRWCFSSTSQLKYVRSQKHESHQKWCHTLDSSRAVNDSFSEDIFLIAWNMVEEVKIISDFSFLLFLGNFLSSSAVSSRSRSFLFFAPLFFWSGKDVLPEKNYGRERAYIFYQQLVDCSWSTVVGRCPGGGRGERNPIYEPYRYVPPQRVPFSSISSLK